LKCDSTRAETRFRLSAKRTSPFKSTGLSVRSTTGSRGVRVSASNAGYTMFRGSVKSIGYPLHLPVPPSLPLRASACAVTFHLDSTASLFASGLRDGGTSCIRINSDSLLKLAMNERQVFIQCLRKTTCSLLKKSLVHIKSASLTLVFPSSGRSRSHGFKRYCTLPVCRQTPCLINN
jgi:hypothetical protein